jgi:hypothetical protein
MSGAANTQAVKIAADLAEKIQRIRTMGDSIGVIVGRTSVAQAVQNVRKMAAELVFSLQRNAESEDVINYIKSLQGGLLGLQVYGAISEAELENYLIETDKIQDLIEKQ